MIRDAGFEIDGNDLYFEREQSTRADAGAGAGQFRIPGGGDELLKPEIAQR
jgi:hypothetical protein